MRDGLGLGVSASTADFVHGLADGDYPRSIFNHCMLRRCLPMSDAISASSPPSGPLASNLPYMVLI